MAPTHGTKKLITVVGPTASGKTALAIELAQLFKTEIISADSRQFYREMTIGTAKPTPGEQHQARHHFVDSHSVTEYFSVGEFEAQGLALLDTLFDTRDHVIMVGGSGLYVKAICEGFDKVPPSSPGIREKLNKMLQEEGLAFLQDLLKQADPVYYNQVDLSNPQRLIRALEVYESTGIAFSSFRKSDPVPRAFDCVKIGIDMPRDILYDRINRRVDAMVEQGLVDEVRSLRPYRHLNALNTVGYSELFDYFDGKTDLETAIALIKQNTRRFAKRQLTWFRKDKDVLWIDPANAKLSDIIQQH